MHSRMTTILACAFSMLIVAPAQAQPTQGNRVLLVVSSYGADEGRTRPGFEMDELSQAYAVFTDNGLTVDIASPSGGAVVADRYNRNQAYNSRFLADPAATAMLANTRTLASVRSETYAAVFVIGGKGAMFDLPVSVDLKTVIAATYQAGGVIGAVCHGPAVLMNIPLADGRFLLDGRSVTGFTNEEEALFGKNWAPSFPVLLENGLRGSGATFSEAPIMLNHVVTDGRLVTGQNPYSTAAAAEAVVRAMGRTPVAREPWVDERSIDLIARAMNGDLAGARAAFHANPELYDAPLIAIWGYYRAQSAGSDRAALSHAVDMMELAATHFSQPELVEAISNGRRLLSDMP